MIMRKIVENAKWIVLVFGTLLVIGLIFMGNYNSLSGRVSHDVGKVNGTTIPYETFSKEMENFQELKRNNTGKTPEGIELVKMRKELFDYKVREIILQQLITEYELFASSEEMFLYLEKNPDPRIQQDTANFHTNGSFDQNKYIQWLHDPQTLSMPYIQYMEARMKSAIIPEMQIRHLMRAQYHQTALELAYDDFRTKSKMKLVYYSVPLDSFEVAESAITESELTEYFKSHPDSFYTKEESAQLGYIQMAITPSKKDSTISLELIEDLRRRVEVDSNFENLAISYSDDEKSAEDGGSLGGFQTKETWVPKFAEVAFNLKKGEISQPVKTQFGYHLIKCNDIKTEDSVTKVDASHILIKIEPTPETVDDLVKDMELIRQKAIAAKSLEQISKDKNFQYQTTKVFFKWDFAPFGENNYVSGIHSFAFGKSARKVQVSEVLQNESSVYLFEKRSKYPKGRHFEQAKDKIRSILVTQKKKELAKSALSDHISAITAQSGPDYAGSFGKAKFDSTSKISPKSWVSGVGYNTEAINRVFKLEKGQWSEILTTESAAIICKMVEKQTANFDEVLSEMARSEVKEYDYHYSNLNKQWFSDLDKSASIENNLDLVYRN